jgi:hypothetical protein
MGIGDLPAVGCGPVGFRLREEDGTARWIS